MSRHLPGCRRLIWFYVVPHRRFSDKNDGLALHVWIACDSEKVGGDKTEGRNIEWDKAEGARKKLGSRQLV